VKKPKDNLPTKPAVNVPTPLDLSHLKAEKDRADRAYSHALLADRQAQVPNYFVINSFQFARLQMPANTPPEMHEEVRRRWLEQQALMSAQANGQSLRAPLVGRSLVIPGGPNGRPLPIRPNTGSNPAASGAIPARLPNGTPTTEQMQSILKARQLALASSPNPTAMRLAQVRAYQQAQAAQQAQQQQAQLNAAQNTNSNQTTEFIPFPVQNNGPNLQCMLFLDYCADV